jgi:hypothetical protein
MDKCLEIMEEFKEKDLQLSKIVEEKKFNDFEAQSKLEKEVDDLRVKEKSDQNYLNMLEANFKREL